MPPVKQLFALTILATAAEAQQPMVPVLNQMVPDVVLVAGEDGETFALGDHFGMEEIRDDAVRLMAEWTLLDGTVKTVDIDFLLFETPTPGRLRPHARVGRISADAVPAHTIAVDTLGNAFSAEVADLPFIQPNYKR